MEIKVEILKTEYTLADSETNPSIRIFVSDMNRGTLPGQWKSAAPIPKDTIVGIDCYTKQKNYDGVLCMYRLSLIHI